METNVELAARPIGVGGSLSASSLLISLARRMEKCEEIKWITGDKNSAIAFRLRYGDGVWPINSRQLFKLSTSWPVTRAVANVEKEGKRAVGDCT